MRDIIRREKRGHLLRDKYNGAQKSYTTTNIMTIFVRANEKDVEVKV